MSDFSFNDLAANPGTNTGTWFRDLSNAAANLSCQLYHQFPDWLLGQYQATGGIADMANQMMNNLCSPRPGYQPPVQPGSIKCWKFSGFGYGGESYALFACGVTPAYITEGPDGGGNYYDVPTLDGAKVVSRPYGYKQGTGSYVAVTEISSSANYTEGDCPCLTNPPPPTPAPQPTDLTVNTTVNNINTPVTFKSFNPSYGLHISVGGTNIRLDHNGVTYNDPQFNSNNIQNTSNISAIATATDTINNNLNTLVIAPSLVLTPTIHPPSQGGSNNNRTTMRIVTITLASYNAQQESSFGDSALEVFKAGYFNFTRGEYKFEGQPIRYAHNIFVVPPGADGYQYKLFRSFIGYATEYDA